MSTLGSARRLRILVVSPQLPYPPSWGFGIRVYQLVRYLAERHEVTVLCYVRPNEVNHARSLSESCAVRAIPAPRGLFAAKRRAQLASLLAGHSYRRQSVRSEAMRSAIRRMCDAEQYDLIQVESSPMAWFDPGRARLLIDEHNIEYELLSRMGSSERSAPRRLFNQIEFLKLRREEQRSWRESDGTILTSEREAALVRHIVPNLPTTVVPNCVDAEYFQPAGGIVDDDGLVFTGIFNYRPNVDAVLYFAREILPRIRKLHPAAHLTVVGGSVPSEISALQGPFIRVTGWVPDVRPFVEASAVVVVPLRMGSGTRLKVVEGLAMARPVVSTSIGAEGLSLKHGEHLQIADNPQEFAEQVVRLLRDPGLRQELGRAGRALVEAAYSWEIAGRRLEAFYARLLEARVRVA